MKGRKILKYSIGLPMLFLMIITVIVSYIIMWIVVPDLAEDFGDIKEVIKVD